MRTTVLAYTICFMSTAAGATPALSKLCSFTINLLSSLLNCSSLPAVIVITVETNRRVPSVIPAISTDVFTTKPVAEEGNLKYHPSPMCSHDLVALCGFLIHRCG